MGVSLLDVATRVLYTSNCKAWRIRALRWVVSPSPGLPSTSFPGLGLSFMEMTGHAPALRHDLCLPSVLGEALQVFLRSQTKLISVAGEG